MDTARHTLADREPVRIAAIAVAVWGVAVACLAWAGISVPGEVTGAVTALLALLGGEAARSRAWAPASVEDLGVLDPDEDGTDPDAVAL
jgi:hypothetical protein